MIPLCWSKCEVKDASTHTDWTGTLRTQTDRLLFPRIQVPEVRGRRMNRFLSQLDEHHQFQWQWMVNRHTVEGTTWCSKANWIESVVHPQETMHTAEKVPLTLTKPKLLYGAKWFLNLHYGGFNSDLSQSVALWLQDLWFWIYHIREVKSRTNIHLKWLLSHIIQITPNHDFPVPCWRGSQT